MSEKINATNVLLGKPARKRDLERQKRRRVNNIKMDL
jgi:hypothetical protein